MSNNFPSNEKLTSALLRSLKDLGGKGSVTDIDAKVAEILDLPAELTKVLRTGNRTEFQYRMAWVRTRAKKNGLIERVETKIWALKAS